MKVSRLEPSKGGRRERRRDETRARIARCAAALFARQGFLNTTVEQITEAADVAKGTFFNYFPAKEYLMFEMASQAMARLHDAADHVHELSSVKPLLLALPENFVNGPAQSQIMLRSMLGTLLSNESLTQHAQGMFQEVRKQIAKILAHGQALGEVRPDMPAETLARMMQQTVWGTLLVWCLSPESDVLERLHLAIEMLWCGIQAGGAESSKGKARKEKKRS